MKKISWVRESIRFAQDAESGAEIEQLTSEPVTSTNIYCEQRYAASDGSRIALSRKPFGQPAQLWVCDMGSLSVCHVAEGRAVGANPLRNAIYYINSRQDDARLMRLDLLSLETTELFQFGEIPAPNSGTISPDERYFTGGPIPVRDNVMALVSINLQRGDSRILCEIEDMINPHVQYEPASGRQLLVQVNRGGRSAPTGGPIRLSGPLGATLCVVDADSGEVQPLAAGRPYTPPITGHECWIGQSGRVLFSAGQFHVTASAYVTTTEPPENEAHFPVSALYTAAPGDSEARVLASGLLFNHLAASDDGRFFIGEDHTTARIYIGSIASGRYLPLCDSHTRQGSCQYSHAHAYMTPDNRHVIFNSIVTGVAQVYAARIPEGFLDRVLNL